MEINRVYYGDDTEFSYYNRIKKSFTPENFPINRKLDNSITASASQYEYAPYNNIASYSPKYGDNINAGYYEIHTKDLQQFVLVDGDVQSSPFYEYDDRYGYEITTYKTNISPYLVSGFKYLSITFYLKIAVLRNNEFLEIFFDEYDSNSDIAMYVFFYSYGTIDNGFELNDREITIYNKKLKIGDVDFEKKKMIYYRPFRTQNRIRIPICGVIPNIDNKLKITATASTSGTKNASISIFNPDFCNITISDNVLSISIDITNKKELILKAASTYGFIFSTKDDTALNTLTNENIGNYEFIYVPTITENGFYNGDYTHGADNFKQKQIVENWNDDKNAPYNNGVKDFDNIDNNKYTDKMVRGTGRQSGQFNNSYVITEQNMKKLQKLLNVKSVDDTTPEIYKNLLFMGSNPMECITSINWYPVGIPIGAPTNLILGSYTTDIAVTTVQSFTKTVNMGFCDIKPIHENHYFLNFEPYSYYLLYAPFCGWYPLDSKKVVGKNIQLYMNIDFLSGTCAVEVWIDSSIETVLNGIISAPVSVQAFSQNDYFNSRINSIKNIGSDIINSSGAIASNIMQKNPVGTATSIAGGALSLTSDIFSFVRPEMRYNSITANTANLSTYNPTSSYIARYTVTEQIPTNYNSTVGYACEFTANVNTLSGYTVFSNFNCNGISATDIEKNEIKALAENGIYI